MLMLLKFGKRFKPLIREAQTRKSQLTLLNNEGKL